MMKAIMSKVKYLWSHNIDTFCSFYALVVSIWATISSDNIFCTILFAFFTILISGLGFLVFKDALKDSSSDR